MFAFTLFFIKKDSTSLERRDGVYHLFLFTQSLNDLNSQDLQLIIQNQF